MKGLADILAFLIIIMSLMLTLVPKQDTKLLERKGSIIVDTDYTLLGNWITVKDGDSLTGYKVSTELFFNYRLYDTIK